LKAHALELMRESMRFLDIIFLCRYTEQAGQNTNNESNKIINTDPSIDTETTLSLNIAKPKEEILVSNKRVKLDTPTLKGSINLQGGILFYVDETGKHGLIVGNEDLGEFNWGCLNITIPGADIIDIGGGLQNTIDIMAGCSDRPIAASIAFEYEYGDYADWYLPSRRELKEIYLSVGQGSEIGNIGGFIDSWYWSSTEDEIPEAAYCFSFIYGEEGKEER